MPVEVGSSSIKPNKYHSLQIRNPFSTLFTRFLENLLLLTMKLFALVALVSVAAALPTISNEARAPAVERPVACTWCFTKRLENLIGVTKRAPVPEPEPEPVRCPTNYPNCIITKREEVA